MRNHQFVRTAIATAIFAALSISVAHAQSGGGYKMLVGTISSGGGMSGGGGYSAYGVTGQPLVGGTSGGSFSTSAGHIDASNDPLPSWPTFTAWQQAFFSPAQLSDPNISGATSDADGDGLANLLEYAFYSDPNNPAAPGQPHLTLDSNYLSIVYTRSLSASDVTFAIWESTDLKTWTVVSPLNQVLFDDGFMQTIQSRVLRSDAGPGGKLFLRIRVTQP